MQDLGVELAGGADRDPHPMRVRCFELAFDGGKRLGEVRGCPDERLVRRYPKGREDKQPSPGCASRSRAGRIAGRGRRHLAAPENRYSALSAALRRNSQTQNTVAMTAPAIWKAMKAGASIGRMPENVSVKLRPNVTAGLAKLVEEVNQ